jgi:lipoyl(octanoyl) transferase
LKDFGIAGERREGFTGVWVVGKEKKIASIGVAASAWVTFHGTALNVTNDLTGFSRVRPCGLKSEVMTSMQAELGDACPTIQDVKDSFLTHFARHFERSLLI